ncbi:MAG: sigma-70 family RNA polymerase sigma factor [Bacteroidota bacterium]
MQSSIYFMQPFSPNLSLSSYDPLWEKLRAGDQEALKDLYENYAQLLFNYGRHISSDKELVRDCIQDLFITLWNSHLQLKPTTSVRFYLYRSLRRKIIAETKKISQQLSTPTSSSELVELQTLSGFLNDDLQERQKRKDYLIKAIQALPNRQQEVLMLIFFENLTRSEVAEVMEISVDTVYTLTSKALKALRKSLVKENLVPQLIISFLLLFLL